MISIIRDTGSLEITGHAGYAEWGKDIVCAGVSAITFTLLENIKDMGIKHTVIQEDGRICLTYQCNRDQQLGEKLISGICKGYKLLAQNYPKYIRYSNRKNGSHQDNTNDRILP